MGAVETSDSVSASGSVCWLSAPMYLRYNAKNEADLASMDMWERLLGHPINPNDTTTFIFQCIHCPNNNSAYMILTEPLYSELYPKLTQQEKDYINANMVPVSNTQVQTCLEAIEAEKPPMP
jgi:hypothetical protein